MLNYVSLKQLFQNICNSIRNFKGLSNTTKIKVSNIPNEIKNITNNATATASDLANGVIAYGKNGKITGNITTYGVNKVYTHQTLSIATTADKKIILDFTPSQDILFRKSSVCRIAYPLEYLGTAIANDVAKGKTFTSASGIKIAGTADFSAPTYKTLGVINTSDEDITLFYTSDSGVVLTTLVANENRPDVVFQTGSGVLAMINNANKRINMLENNPSWTLDGEVPQRLYFSIPADFTETEIPFNTVDIT